MAKLLPSIVIFIIVVVGAFWYLSTTENNPQGNDQEGVSAEARYFIDEVERLAVEKVGQPIEGFSAEVYLEAFPGLTLDDFDQVSTLEGYYDIKYDKLMYVRTEESPVTSAEKTISNEGMETLLNNLSERLGVEATDEQKLDTIIQLISASETDNDDGDTISTSTTMNQAILKTSKGDITLEFYPELAPNTVSNFQKLAENDFYDRVTFHRVIDGFMVQGGDPTGTGRGGPGYAFDDELDPSSDIAKQGYTRGTVAMANSGPNTNGSQFFIVHQDTPLPYDYTIFGKVVSGMDVVDAIATVETDESDKPLEDIVIQDVEIK